MSAEKRYFLVESSTDLHSLFAYEVTEGDLGSKDGSIQYTYHRPVGAGFLFNESNRPKFFGKLSALLVTKGDLANAPAMELVEPKVEVA